MLHRDRRHRRNAQCPGPLAGRWCRCYIVVGPARFLEVGHFVVVASDSACYSGQQRSACLSGGLQ